MKVTYRTGKFLKLPEFHEFVLKEPRNPDESETGWTHPPGKADGSDAPTAADSNEFGGAIEISMRIDRESLLNAMGLILTYQAAATPP